MQIIYESIQYVKLQKMLRNEDFIKVSKIGDRSPEQHEGFAFINYYCEG